MTPAVLIVDNDESGRRCLKDALSALGYETFEAAYADEAFHVLITHHIDAILTDLVMPGGGIAYIARLRAQFPGCRIIAVSGRNDPETRAAVLRWGALAFLAKPFELQVLRAVVSEALAAEGV
jgi:DNA-binding response OmpR family regulator